MRTPTRGWPSASSARRPRAEGAAPLRWNPEPEDVQKSVAQLVLTIVEFLRQADGAAGDPAHGAEDADAQGSGSRRQALMKLEETVRDIGAQFGLTPRI